MNLDIETRFSDWLLYLEREAEFLQRGKNIVLDEISKLQIEEITLRRILSAPTPPSSPQLASDSMEDPWITPTMGVANNN